MPSSPSFPQALTALPQWVCWRMEPDARSARDAKVPYNPHTGRRASASNLATWGTLAQAQACAEKYHFTGLGFVFTQECGIIGLDIDHCLTDGKPNETAADILSHIPPTYIEISPSGTGLHIFLKGALPPGGNRNSTHGVEIYSHARYFTMTGKKYQGAVDFIAEDNGGALEYIHQKYIAAGKKTRKSNTNSMPGTLADDEILRLAQASKDGSNFDALWRGDWQSKYKSQSEADCALCCKLAFWSGRSEAQVDRLFRSSGLYREKWDSKHSAGGQTYGETTVQRACEMTTSVYTPPAPKRQPDIFEQGGCYYRRKNENYQRITNFTVEPVQMICGEDETQLTCDLITENGERFSQQLLSSDFSTVPKFKAILNKKTIALSFLGTETDLELLKIHVYGLKWQQKKGVKALGIYTHKRGLVFVTSDGAVGVGGKRVNSIVQMERFKSLDSGILQANMLEKDGLLRLSEHILGYNEPAKVAPILAWTSACFIKPHLKKVGIKFPHLFLIGESGSGKSQTLERVILPVFSRTKVVPSSQVTNFTLMSDGASSNMIPQAFDEFKPSTIDKQRVNWLYNHFRSGYDWHEAQRGRSDQSTVKYDLLAPNVVAGEESPDEAAIRERSIELLFSRRDLDEEREAHYIWLRDNAELLGSFGRSLLDTALDTMPSEVLQWFVEGRGFFKSKLPQRVLDNLCCLYAGLSLVVKLCGRLGLSWNEAFSFDREACVNHIEYAARNYLLDGGANRSIVEQTFEVMSRMRLKPGVDYAFENGHDIMCIKLCDVYDRYTKYRRECAIVGEVLPYNQFKKQLAHSQYFIAANQQKRLDRVTNQKAWVINFAVLSRKCDVEGFIRAEEDEPAQLRLSL